MAKLPRKRQKVFGSTAGALQISKFGSLAAGAPVFDTDPDVIQQLANFEQGWFAAILGNSNPAIEDMNALFYLYAYQLAYIFQSGVPEWQTGTTYYIGSVVNDGTGALYKSIQDGNTGHAVGDTAWWSTTGGGGGASGLPTQIVSTTSAVLANRVILGVTTSAAITITLPAISVGAQIMFIDAGELAGTYAINIAPATGEQIGTLGVNVPLPINTTRGGYYLFANGSKWSYVSLGATGGGGSSGGLAPAGISGATTAVTNTMYAATMGSAYALTLPGGTTAAVVGFLDAGGMSETNYLDITPAAGQSIDTGAVGEVWRARKAYTQGVLYRVGGTTVWRVQLQSTTQVAGGSLPSALGATIPYPYIGFVKQSFTAGATAALSYGTNNELQNIVLDPGKYSCLGHALLGLTGASAGSITEGMLELSESTTGFLDNESSQTFTQYAARNGRLNSGELIVNVAPGTTKTIRLWAVVSQPVGTTTSFAFANRYITAKLIG